MQVSPFLSFAGLVLFAVTAAAQTPASPFDGLKKTLAVESFHATEATGGAVTAESMTALLTQALARDGRFILVERAALAAVQAEQALGQGGSTQPETAARQGQLIAATAIVRAAVTKYEPLSSGSSVSLGKAVGGSLTSRLAGMLESRSKTAMMEIALRLIDTTTGQVIATSSAQGTSSGSSVGASATHVLTGATGGAGRFENTPIGQAGEQAIVKAVELIAAAMRKVPWSAQVVEVEDNTVFINAGADRNVQPGLAMQVYRKGRVLTDPSTGTVLDVEMRKLGTLRVSAVRERVSVARIESGEPPARGDLLRLD